MQFTEKIEGMQAARDERFGMVVKEMLYVLTCEGAEQQQTCVRRIVLNPPTEAEFVPFENLSEQEAIAWAVQHLGVQEVEAMKNGMKSMIESQSGNVQVPVEAPWMNIKEK